MGLAERANLDQMVDIMARVPFAQRTGTKGGLRMRALLFLEEMADIR